MSLKNQTFINEFLAFLNNSPTAWHAVDSVKNSLVKAKFTELMENETWQLKPNQRYFVQRNGSSLCAFVTPSEKPKRVSLLASHTDSPGFKLKPQPEIKKNNLILLGVEIYGAPLLTSWLNRDLGIAGRILYTNKKKVLKESLIKLDKYPLAIPQLAIHLDREVNEKGVLLNKQDHFNVLAALDNDSSEPYLETLLKEKIDLKELVSADLFLYPLEPALLIGYQQQLIASYRIDSLASVYAALHALLENTQPVQHDIKMIAFWDNEEIGSHTAQGANSPFVSQILERATLAFGLNREEYFCLINQSLCVSIDLAHALHPNYPEKHDAQHQILLSKGVALKTSANQRYASDARSLAPIQAAAQRINLPLQKFVSRNDFPSGSTIGPIHASLSGMPTVDIGTPQLSMHSAREIMACEDLLGMHRLLKEIL